MLPDVILTLARSAPAGLFCRKQILKRGFDDPHILEWRRTGLIERVTCGWYRLADVVQPDDQCLVLPMEYTRHKHIQPRPVLSGRGGLAAYGVPGFPLPCARPAILLQHGGRIRVTDAPWRVLYADLTAVQVQDVGGLPVASPGRCIADLHLEGRGDQHLVEAVDAVRQHLRVPLTDLMAEWEGMRRHDGAAALRRLASTGTLDAESPMERQTLAGVFARFPPAPDAQVQITAHFRADFAFIFAALVLEFYGEAVHATTVDRDATRLAAFRGEGWDTFVITKSQLRRPAELADRVHTIRLEREALILAGRLRRPPLPAQPDRRSPLRTLLPLG